MLSNENEEERKKRQQELLAGMPDALRGSVLGQQLGSTLGRRRYWGIGPDMQNGTFQSHYREALAACRSALPRERFSPNAD
jgi:hypothetical protein